MPSIRDLPDRELWSLVAQGDGPALGELFERHADAVYNHAFRRTADWSAAEEVTSLVFLEAWRRRGDVELERDTALPWLLGVARNVLRNRWRTKRRHRKALARLPEPSAERFDDDVDDRLDDQQRMRRLLELIRGLPASQRDVLELVAWDGLTYEQAAGVLDVPVGTVRSRLSRARRRLAEMEAELAAAADHTDQRPASRLSREMNP